MTMLDARESRGYSKRTIFSRTSTFPSVLCSRSYLFVSSSRILLRSLEFEGLRNSPARNLNAAASCYLCNSRMNGDGGNENDLRGDAAELCKHGN